AHSYRSSNGSWSRNRRVICQAPVFLAPFRPCCGDVRPHDRRIEHLNEMGAFAQAAQRLEKCFEGSRLAEAPKPLPDAVPVTELRRQRPPGDVVHFKIMQRLQKFAVIAARLAAPLPPRP